MSLKVREERQAYQSAYYQANRECIGIRAKKWREEHKEQRRAYLQQYYKDNKERAQVYDRTHLQKLARRETLHRLKLNILSYYSNPSGLPICNNCGEQDIDVLCVDHVNGGGHQEHLRLKRNGSSFYGWLVKSGYPNGYQILCYNCNKKKEIPKF